MHLEHALIRELKKKKKKPNKTNKKRMTTPQDSVEPIYVTTRRAPSKAPLERQHT